MSIRYKRTNWVRFGRLLPAWLLAGFISSLAFAVPVTTNYQGYLENTDGEPLDATVNMTVALYAAAQGGSALWTETHQNVEVTDGVFSLILGDTTSFDDNSLEGERYLGVTVGSDPEMAPRQQLTSAFFAMRAGVADSVKAASVETEAIADGAVTADKIAPQTITGDRIADGVTITAAERQKLEGLTSGGTGSSDSPIFRTVTVQEQISVKNRIKVGENSLYMGDSPTDLGTEQIYTKMYTNIGSVVVTPALRIQSMEYPDNSGYKNPNTIINGLEGNVGIGTGIDDNSPEEKLHVNGAVLLEPLIAVPLDTDNRLYNVSGVSDVDDGLYWAGILLNGSSGADDDWTIADSNIYRTDGNVGIGTDDPKGKLDVAGTLKVVQGIVNGDTFKAYNEKGLFFNYLDGWGDVAVLKQNTFPVNGGKLEFAGLEISGDPLVLNAYTDPNRPDKQSFEGTGNVGVGTKTPKNKLDVAGSVAIGSAYAGINAAPDNGLIVEGNVGIGTDNPKGKLDVDGMFKISPKAFSASEYLSNGTGIFINYDTNNPLGEGGAIKSLNSDDLKFKKLAIDGSPTLINAAGFSGNVGIGTKNPSCKLHVKGKVCADSIQTTESTVPTGQVKSTKMIHSGIWGDWHGWQYCPPKTYVCGARVRFEASQGGGVKNDDTAMNGIEFACCSFVSSSSFNWKEHILSGKSFKIVLAYTNFDDPESANGPLGSIKAGNTYSCTYKSSQFTCYGYNQSTHGNGSWTYSNANPDNGEISVWGRVFTFNTDGEVYDSQYGLVGFLSK